MLSDEMVNCGKSLLSSEKVEYLEPSIVAVIASVVVYSSSFSKVSE